MATKNAWGSNLPAEVAYGCTGRATITDGTVMVGNGTDPVEMLALSKGSIVAATTSGAAERTGGTDDFVLTADSSDPTGVSWKDPNTLVSAGGGWTPVSTTTISTTTDTIAFTGLNEANTAYRIIAMGIQFDGDTAKYTLEVSTNSGGVWESSNYYYHGVGTNTSSTPLDAGNTSTSQSIITSWQTAYDSDSHYSGIDFIIWNCQSASSWKIGQFKQLAIGGPNETKEGIHLLTATCGWADVTAVDSLRLGSASGDFTTGIVYLLKLGLS